MGYMDPDDQNRIKIQDNVLTISYLDDERDPGMYQCRASNTLKTRYSSAQLRVLCKYSSINFNLNFFSMPHEQCKSPIPLTFLAICCLAQIRSIIISFSNIKKILQLLNLHSKNIPWNSKRTLQRPVTSP